MATDGRVVLFVVNVSGEMNVSEVGPFTGHLRSHIKDFLISTDSEQLLKLPK